MAAEIAITRTDHIDWKAALWAGLIGGAVFMMLEMLMVAVFLGKSPWGPPHMIAAIALGKGVLPMPGGPPPTFDGGVLLAAMAVHFILSIIFAFILAWVLKGRPYGTSLLIGVVFGLVLYLVDFYLLTGIFPWFAMARNWVTIFSHLAFGLVTAMTYKSLGGSVASSRTARMA